MDMKTLKTNTTLIHTLKVMAMLLLASQTNAQSDQEASVQSDQEAIAQKMQNPLSLELHTMTGCLAEVGTSVRRCGA